MMIPTCFLICLFIVLQLNSNIVLGQRDFANPAVTDPAPCACDLQAYSCDPNCCCDPDCDNNDLSASPVCQSVRTVSSYSSSQEENLQTWNCSNSTSDALYDYFPFVCVQMTLNEVIGEFYPTDNVSFVTTGDNVGDLPTTFAAEYPELFQLTTLSTTASTSPTYSIGAPVQTQSGLLTLPANLIGLICQQNAAVLFGVNSDTACQSTINLCTAVTSISSVLQGGGSSSSVSVNFYTQIYTSPNSTTINPATEYYFQTSYSLTINNISSVNGSIFDYCPNQHPLNRTQRYFSACTSTSGCNNNGYQTWSGCSERDTFSYYAIPANFFLNGSSSTDDSTNFADFNNAMNTSLASLISACSGNYIRRVLYRFYYSSSDNIISNVTAYILTQPQTSAVTSPRITIEWHDIADNLASDATIPRGYLTGEVLQFRQNAAISDVSVLVPTSSGYCVDATPETLRYKKSTSSQCFIQLAESTIQQCHNLKLNMYLYLNIFYAPASDVLAYPNANATQIPIRNATQDSLDLDQIDETRPDNRLNISYITQTSLNGSTPTIYDIVQNVPICFNVPSGIYIEFGFVRVTVSPTVSFERIVSVRYNYTYSNWQFDCNSATCNSTTQKYLVTFQSAFVDYTDLAFNLPTVTTADMTSADNYIQQLLWLITPQYNGEPGYRNYTIAMILIFIAISGVVIHVLLFGIMCPF